MRIELVLTGLSATVVGGLVGIDVYGKAWANALGAIGGRGAPNDMSQDMVIAICLAAVIIGIATLITGLSMKPREKHESGSD